jgi:hypothetical protein
MALTVYQQPQVLTPAYNDQIFTALSNQIAVSDFKYIVTIQVNGGVIYTYNILQRPDGWLVFNAMEQTKNFISHYFNPLLASPYNEIATGKSAVVQLKIKEYYTAAIQSTTTINYNVFDACLKQEDFDNYNYNNFLLDNISINNLFLNGNLELESRQDLFIHFRKNPAINLVKLVLVLYSTSPSFTVIESKFFNIVAPVNTYDTIVANIGTKCFTTTPVDGNQVIVYFLDNNTTSLPINGINVVNSALYNVNDIYTKFTKYFLYYLDRTGNIMFFTFELVSNFVDSIKRNTVNQKRKKLNTSTGAYTNNTWDSEAFVISTDVSTKITLNSDWITEAQSTSLNDLFTSPIVYLLKPDGKYRAVQITMREHKYQKHENETLFNYVVECDLGITETRQRGL